VSASAPTGQPASAPTGKQFEIQAGDHRAVIVEVGAGLRLYEVAGRPVTEPYGEHELPPRYSGATLAPWPNRIRGGAYEFDGIAQQLAITDVELGNAMHGLLDWERWAVVDQTAHSVTLSCDTVPQYGYPYRVQVEVTYRLDASAGLRVDSRARNLSLSAAPFGFGAHPYLHQGGVPTAEVSLRIPSATVLLTDDAQIPIGRADVAGAQFDLRAGGPLRDLYLDSGFVRDAGSEVVIVAGGVTTTVWMDSSFGYVQVFTCPDLAHGVPALAVEPMTCPADAFRSGEGLIELPAADDGEWQWSGSWGIKTEGS
jgi:aldose 1-epimerase